MDLFHVAIAIETGADAILTFDGEQKALAEAAGIRILPLAVRRAGREKKATICHVFPTKERLKSAVTTDQRKEFSISSGTASSPS